MNAFQRVAKIVNSVVTPLLHAPVLGRRMSKTVAIVSYTGRRSGKTISTPVNYLQQNDSTIAIGVMAPDKKTWWRNFYPDPAPMTIDIAGVERSGTAIAHRDDNGAVNVELTLDSK
ncbi:nitroreductase/quinone reductase family protein [Rhodococcus koreensis]